MKIKRLIREKTTQVDIFKLTFTYTDDKGTYTHNVDIPDRIVSLHYGDRKLRKILEDLQIEDIRKFYATDLPLYLSNLANIYAYRWHKLLDLEHLYYNPLWNVDGVEKTTTEHGLRKTTDSFGDTSTTTSYGEDIQSVAFGVDKTTQITGEQNGTSTHKTNPFNDSNTSYTTDIDTNKIDSHTDTNTRDSHTDTTTRNQHSDITTGTAHSDTHTTDKVTDIVTFERSGNIGMTKSTELLGDVVALRFNVTYEILNDIMNELTRGY